MKKTLWKDSLRTLTHSWARFFSIFGLIALGTFALIGLKVTGPNMRSTAQNLYDTHNLADIQILSNVGLDQSDADLLSNNSSIKSLEFGYLVDTVFENTSTSVRLFSNTKEISTFEVVEGRLPEKKGELALDNQYSSLYKIGDVIHVDQQATLEQTTFMVVGYVNSVEMINKEQRGATSVGTGELNAFGVVTQEDFNSEVYSIARIRFVDTVGLNPFDDAYSNVVKNHRSELETIFESQAINRRDILQKEPLQKINDTIQEIEMNLSKLRSLGSSARNQIEALEENLTSLQTSKQNIESIQVTYTIRDRDDIPGYTLFAENTHRTDMLSSVFPTFLYAIAALVCLTTMTRMVDEQRINSGTLKALGYKSSDIRMKFVFYGIFASLVGSIVGILGGHILLPKVIYGASAANFILPPLQLHFYLRFTLAALLISLFCTVGVTIIVVNKELKQKAAILLLPKPPKNGSRILLERIPFIWKHLSFNYKVTFRNIFRYKQRMFMTILGVAGCTALLISGFGLRDSMSGIVNRQYQDIIHYNMVAIQSDNLSEEQSKFVQTSMDQEPKIERSYALNIQSIQAHQTNQDIVDLQVMAMDQPDQFNAFISLFDSKTSKPIQISNDGAIITQKLSELLNVKVGDSIELYDANNQVYTTHVQAIAEMYVGHYVFMSNDQYEEVFKTTFTQNAHLIKVVDEHKIDDVASNVMKIDGIKSVQQSHQIIDSIQTILLGLDKVISVLIVCAIILAMIVIFNLTNINVAERIRELSTIKVLGFYPDEVTLYIYRETLILSIIGIVVGYMMGFALHRIMILNLPPNNVMFYAQLIWSNIVKSAVITVVITLVVMFIIHRKLKRVNMLDALKSVD